LKVVYKEFTLLSELHTAVCTAVMPDAAACGGASLGAAVSSSMPARAASEISSVGGAALAVLPFEAELLPCVGGTFSGDFIFLLILIG
jgi:hypothetical protein